MRKLFALFFLVPFVNQASDFDGLYHFVTEDSPIQLLVKDKYAELLGIQTKQLQMSGRVDLDTLHLYDGKSLRYQLVKGDDMEFKFYDTARDTMSFYTFCRVKDWYPSGFIKSEIILKKADVLNGIEQYTQRIYFDSCRIDLQQYELNKKRPVMGMKSELIKEGKYHDLYRTYYHPKEVLPDWNPFLAQLINDGQVKDERGWYLQIPLLKTSGPPILDTKEAKKYFNVQGQLTAEERKACRICGFSNWKFFNRNDSDAYFQDFDFFEMKGKHATTRDKGRYHIVHQDTAMVVQYYDNSNTEYEHQKTFFIRHSEIPLAQNTIHDCCAGGSKIERRYFYGDSIVSYFYIEGSVRGDEPKVEDGHILMYMKRVITKESLVERKYNYQKVTSRDLEYTFKTIESNPIKKEPLSWRKVDFQNDFLSSEVIYTSNIQSASPAKFQIVSLSNGREWWSENWVIKPIVTN